MTKHEKDQLLALANAPNGQAMTGGTKVSGVLSLLHSKQECVNRIGRVDAMVLVLVDVN